jgi:CRP/FNR family transcriptional regulator, cyclic AMP receptor protein
MTANERREVLAACRLFQGLDGDDTALTDLAEVCEDRRASAGSLLIEEGSEGDTMYVMRSGSVRVEKRTMYRDAYTVTVISGRDGGAFFGELALLDRDKRSASVVAESACELIVIRRDRFHAWGDRHFSAGLLATRRIAEHLADRLRRANADIVTLFTALVRELEQRL